MRGGGGGCNARGERRGGREDQTLSRFSYRVCVVCVGGIVAKIASFWREERLRETGRGEGEGGAFIRSLSSSPYERNQIQPPCSVEEASRPFSSNYVDLCDEHQHHQHHQRINGNYVPQHAEAQAKYSVHIFHNTCVCHHVTRSLACMRRVPPPITTHQ